ncbi:hypothetical protein [Streptomyces sp. XH2]|uniref:hypothetical protein n=1 Tax=Streptomyces sp. XH2 TaxID=3412483 RepID=UPI003C7B5432
MAAIRAGIDVLGDFEREHRLDPAPGLNRQARQPVDGALEDRASARNPSIR